MEVMIVKPEKEQKTLWIIDWIVPSVLGLVLWIVLLFLVDKLIFGICLALWLVLMFAILLWIPAFYRSLEYVVDSDSVRMKKGVFWRKRVAVPYPKITNVDVTQGPIQRMFSIGTIHVQTAGAGGNSELPPWRQFIQHGDSGGILRGGGTGREAELRYSLPG